MPFPRPSALLGVNEGWGRVPSWLQVSEGKPMSEGWEGTPRQLEYYRESIFNEVPQISQLGLVWVYPGELPDDVASEAYSVQAPDLAFISFLLLLLRTLARLSITQGLGPKKLSLISSS